MSLRALIVADVCASVSLYEKLGESEAPHAIERCLKRMSRAIEVYRGKVLQVAGDELFAVFDSADDAAQAAVEMQLRIDDLPPVSGHKLAIRVGLHLGMLSDEAGMAGSETHKIAARLAGIAQGGEILTSTAFAQALPQHSLLSFKPQPASHPVLELNRPLHIQQLLWHGQALAAAPPMPVENTTPSRNMVVRLGVRYHGHAFLLDDKSPMLSLGRDISNELVIEDRRASRLHARIERRDDHYYYIDISTNGSFVSQTGGQEVMVRRHDLLLEGSGRICFGSSSNDPSADCAEFEHL
jgi:class 3 adenylate cyclase